MSFDNLLQVLNDMSFSELRPAVEKMTESEKIATRLTLEGISKRAAMFAAYIDTRETCGASDQGHAKAVKNCNRAGKIVWVNAFGYNGFHDIKF